MSNKFNKRGKNEREADFRHQGKAEMVVKQKKKKRGIQRLQYHLQFQVFPGGLGNDTQKSKKRRGKGNKYELFICGQADSFKTINIVLFLKLTSNIYAFWSVVLAEKIVPHSLNN